MRTSERTLKHEKTKERRYLYAVSRRLVVSTDSGGDVGRLSSLNVEVEESEVSRETVNGGGLS